MSNGISIFVFFFKKIHNLFHLLEDLINHILGNPYNWLFKLYLQHHYPPHFSLFSKHLNHFWETSSYAGSPYLCFATADLLWRMKPNPPFHFTSFLLFFFLHLLRSYCSPTPPWKKLFFYIYLAFHTYPPASPSSNTTLLVQVNSKVYYFVLIFGLMEMHSCLSLTFYLGDAWCFIFFLVFLVISLNIPF